MKNHVFMILAHKNVKLLKDLIHTLSLYNGDIIVHFDAKNPVNTEEIFKHEIESGKVYFINNNIKVFWGGSSLVWASMLLIDFALKKFPGKDYYHLLSEQCYPVKSPIYFQQFFNKYKGVNFIEVFELPATKWKKNGGLDRINFYHLNDYFNRKSAYLKNSPVFLLNSLMYKVQKAVRFKRKYPPTFPKLYGGSQWWSLTYDCLKYIHDYHHGNNTFSKRFLLTLIADEIYVQTIFMTSPYAWNIPKTDQSIRFTDFSRKYTKQVGILQVDNYWEEIQKPTYLFARKVNPDDDSFTKKVKQEIILKNS